MGFKLQPNNNDSPSPFSLKNEGTINELQNTSGQNPTANETENQTQNQPENTFDVNKKIAEVKAIRDNVEKKRLAHLQNRFGNKAEQKNIEQGGKNVM